MIRKLYFFVFFLTCLSLTNSFSQTKYWFFLSDKGITNEVADCENNLQNLSSEKLVAEFSDIPVNEDYCRILQEIAPISVKSKWLNAVSMSVSPSQKKGILALPFVTASLPQTLFVKTASRESDHKLSESQLEHLMMQTGILGGELFKENNINGKGVRIAILDGGFPGVDTMEVFRHIRDEKRIIDTYDFVKKTKDVYDYSSHGTTVMACIAGIYDGVPIGLGTKAEFLLARTEINTEVFSEEENWVAAMEWAADNGAKIISSSLGYTYHRYFSTQMDGKTTFVSRMANIAASKGILVVNAIGNDGDKDWEVMGAPADADSVLSIGGIDSRKGIHSKFSSFGPTFDNRLKPNVVAFSDVISAGKKGMGKHFGTSFSAPLISGFAACVMQMHPDWNAMKVFDEIQKSGHLYPYYDYAHGYGIPQASYFLTEKSDNEPAFTLEELSGNLIVNILNNTTNSDSLTLNESQEATLQNGDFSGFSEAETDNVGFDVVKSASEMLKGNFMYYHLADAESGKIRKYFVIDLQGADHYKISLDELKGNEILRVHFHGYTQSFKP